MEEYLGIKFELFFFFFPKDELLIHHLCNTGIGYMPYDVSL